MKQVRKLILGTGVREVWERVDNSVWTLAASKIGNLVWDKTGQQAEEHITDQFNEELKWHSVY